MITQKEADLGFRPKNLDYLINEYQSMDSAIVSSIWEMNNGDFVTTEKQLKQLSKEFEV